MLGGCQSVREGVSFCGVITILKRRTSNLSPTTRSICSKTFADQAVIAIENVRLFAAEQQRTPSFPSRWSSRPRRRKSSGHLQFARRSSAGLQRCWRMPFASARRNSAVSIAGTATMHLVATHDTPPAYAEHHSRSSTPLPEFSARPHDSDQSGGSRRRSGGGKGLY